MNLPLFFMNHEGIVSVAEFARDAYLEPYQRPAGYELASDEDTDAQVYFSEETLKIHGVYEKCIVIAFRGTESAKDVVTDLSATRVPLCGTAQPFWKSIMPGFGGVLVHWGFLKQYHSILPEIRRYLNDRPFIKHVITTGHSLGGALATIAAVDLFSRKCGSLRKFSCITLGSPRVGNKKFAERFQQVTGGRSIRIVNNDDPVPLLPSSLRFHHVNGVMELETDNGNGFVRTYLPSNKQRIRRVGRVAWNTVKTTVVCQEGSVSDHSSEKYCRELQELLI